MMLNAELVTIDNYQTAPLLRRLRWWLCKRIDDIAAWWQRLTRGYAYREAWNLCDYLAAYALPRLRHIRDHGVVLHFSDDVQSDKQIMDDIIYSLDLYVRYEFDFHSLTADERKQVEMGDERYNRGLRLFGLYWLHMWD